MGVLKDLERRELPRRDSILIGEMGFAYGSPDMPGSRYIATSGVLSCIVLAAYNHQFKVGLIAHITGDVFVPDALSRAMQIRADSVAFFGGSAMDKQTSGTSISTIIALEKGVRGSPMKVVGRDVLRGDEIRGDAIAMDTENGTFFVPSGCEEPQAAWYSNEWVKIDEQGNRSYRMVYQGTLPQEGFAALVRS